MGNPASELKFFFDEWSQKPKGAAQSLRGFTGSDGSVAKASKHHLEAMRCLVNCSEAIERLAEAGRNVDVFRRMLPNWTQIVINYPHPWQQESLTGQLFTAHALDVLELLAAAIENELPRINPVQVGALQDLLNEAMDALETDESISDELRSHIFRLIQLALNCIREERMLGSVDVRQAIQDLWVSFYAAAAQSDERGKARWKSFADKIMVPATAAILGGLPQTALTVAQITALP